MSLRDELPPAGMPGPHCQLRIFLAASDRRDEWEELVNDQTIGSAQLWTLLRKYGFPSGQNVVARHRRGACACDR